MTQEKKARKPRIKKGVVPPQEQPDAVPVAAIKGRSEAEVGPVTRRQKPKPVVLSSMASRLAPPTYRDKVAAACGPGTASGGGGGGGGYGGGGVTGNMGGGVTTNSAGGNFYSPELSTDFLQLPQSLNEQWAYYRFFYNNEPFVGQAIDIHTEIPLSKIRLARPDAKNAELAEASQRFCENWIQRIGLLRHLMGIVHEYHLIGEAFVFCEDGNPEMPREVREHLTVLEVLEEDGSVSFQEQWTTKPDADERASAWMQKNYKGWTSIRVLPPEQVHIETFQFTDAIMIELIPDGKTKYLLDQAAAGDRRAKAVADTIDPIVRKSILAGENIPLNVDPDEGSFVYYMANKKSPYEARGHSILQRCIRAITHNDIIRQASAMIVSRHMTPVRLIYSADNSMSQQDVELLRDQIDQALQDPDFSIITNFQVTWEELPSNGRMLETSGENDMYLRQLYAGLGVTESLLSGESAYSGDRINLEIVNTRYMLLRELLQDLVYEYFLKPMCKRMGFVEEDEDGNMVVICPRLSFTRLPIRDSADTFEQLMQLYLKGSLPVDYLYDALNIDSREAIEKLKKDALTLRDANMNEALRAMLSGAGQKISDNSNLAQKIAEEHGLEYKDAAEPGRF